jgi:ubiquinone/menaquinone biosynthesis C-methylase UbiE
MSLPRVLETELMDTPEEAADYDAMDHRAVNELFVSDLLTVLASGGRELASRGRDLASGGRDLASGGRKPPGDAARDPGSTGGLTPPARQSETPPARHVLDILDLGTGTAQIPIELCRRFKDCRVMALDAAAHMLESARYNVEAAGPIERIQLVCADAKSLGFADAFFDVVMCNSIVHHIPEPISILRQAVRVARPGGLLFFRDLLRPESKQRLDELVQTYARKENPHARQMFADSLHAALTLDEVRRLVASLGFSPDTVQQTSDRHWTWSARR